MWVSTEDTKLTSDDEVENLICAPCIAKMMSGSCGENMRDFMRCTMKMSRNPEMDPADCLGFFKIAKDCWFAHPKEYASEIKTYTNQDDSVDPSTAWMIERNVQRLEWINEGGFATDLELTSSQL